MDAFFASCEEAKNPKYKGKPLIVGGTKEDIRSIVSCPNYLARARGIKTAMPLKLAFQLAPDGNFIRSTKGLYSDYSKKVFKILSNYTPNLQVASIDEAYLDMTDMKLSEKEYIISAEKIKQEIKKSLNITCSIGISRSKTCAKIASKENKPDGVTLVPFEKEKEFLKNLPVQRIPGVGKSTFDKLKKYEILKIGDFLKHDKKFIEEILGSYGCSLVNLANGIDNRFVKASEEDRKSLSKENTFDFDTKDIKFLKTELYTLLEKSCMRLRKYNEVAKTITVKVKYYDFTVNQKSFTRKLYSNLEMDFFDDAMILLKKLITKNKPVRLLGVKFSELIESGNTFQENIFKDEDKLNTLAANLDAIRKKYDYGIIKFGKNFEK
jgi:DNA polymerase-4